MVTQDHGDLVRSVYTAYNDRDFNRAKGLVTDNLEYLMVPTGQVFRGHEGMKQYLVTWAEGFPESSTRVKDVIVGGNRVAIEYHGRGHHSGTLRTPMWDVPPTGKYVELDFCDTYEIENDKLRSGRSYFDLATMMRQLGLAS